MICEYCGLDHRGECKVDDLKENIEVLSELIESQTAIICDQLAKKLIN